MTFIDRLQLDITAYLQALGDCEYVPVNVISATRDAEVTETLQILDKALSGLNPRGGKAGLGILVPLPSFIPAKGDGPGPSGKVIISVQVIENTLVNNGDAGVGVSCFDLAFAVCSALHRLTLNGVNTIYASPTDGVRPLRLTDDISGDVAFEAVMEMQVNVRPRGRAVQPTISVAAGSITLACSNAESELWYSIDGSLPTPGNGELYTVPFAAPPSGTVVRALANDNINDISQPLYFVIP